MSIKTISKSKFKPKALEFFREVEETGAELIITDRGRPAVKIIPYREEPLEALEQLRDTVVRYEGPTEPVGESEWEAGD